MITIVPHEEYNEGYFILKTGLYSAEAARWAYHFQNIFSDYLKNDFGKDLTFGANVTVHGEIVFVLEDHNNDYTNNIAALKEDIRKTARNIYKVCGDVYCKYVKDMLSKTPGRWRNDVDIGTPRDPASVEIWQTIYRMTNNLHNVMDEVSGGVWIDYTVEDFNHGDYDPDDVEKVRTANENLMLMLHNMFGQEWGDYSFTTFDFNPYMFELDSLEDCERCFRQFAG